MRHVTLALSAVMLIVGAASSASAASRHHARYHHYYGHDYGPYAYGGYRPFNAGGAGSPGPIYRQGHYLGTDPDPSVRFEIARDPYFERK